MSFLETPRFPEDISFGSSGGPQYRTAKTIVHSGHEQRNILWAYPLHRYNAAYGVNNKSQLDALIEFFHAVAGMGHGFRFKDWHDYKSCISTGTLAFTDQVIGTGDGAETEFQLKKTYTKGALSRVRLITKPVSATTVIGINGVQQMSGWTVDTTTGVVTFSSPPGNTLPVTAGFEFDVPCRFDTDFLDVGIEDVLASRANAPVAEIRV